MPSGPLKPSLPPQPVEPAAPEPDHEPEHLRGDLKAVTVYLPEELHIALKHEAVDRGMSVSKIVLEALKSRVRFTDHEAE